MQTLQINIPEGFMIDTFDQSTGVVKFKAKPKVVTERIKTVDDVLADHGLTREQFEEDCENLSKDEVAYRLVKMLVESLNEGWKPDWNNSSQPKYSPWFCMAGSSGFRFHVCDCWLSFSGVGSRLCFKTSELAEYAAKQFVDVYRNFFTE